MSKRIYNMVGQETDICPAGELLTDKELEKLKATCLERDWPKTCRVKVFSEDVYKCFGVRFATVLQEILK